MKRVLRLNLFFLSAVLLGSLASCSSSTRYGTQVAQLDSTITKLNAAQAQLIAVDSGSYMAMRTTMKEQLSFIQGHYDANDDTIPRDRGFLLSNYGSLNKSFKRFTAKRGQYKQKLELLLSQTNALRDDLIHNTVATPGEKATTSSAELERKMSDEERATHYTRVEVEEAKKVCDAIDKFVDIINKTTTSFNELNPQVEAIVEEIKTQQNG